MTRIPAHRPSPRALLRPALLALAGVAALLPSRLLQAATADVAQSPLAASTIAAAKPNIMFILDDSGSMTWDFMPDEIGNQNTYGFRSAQCNGVAYNPAIRYDPPVSVNTDGTIYTYPNASFSAARMDGYDLTSATVNLGGEFYYTYTGTEPALSWSYTADGYSANTTFSAECWTERGRDWFGNYTTAGNSKFTLVNVSSLSATNQQNYANWYSYYRTRQLTMRTAAGRAFLRLDSNYRIGFTKISDTNVSGSSFLDTLDFDNTRKIDFYSKLYTSTAGGSTPLRGALSKVGRYYGGVISGQTDPVQYSCQRNYAILSTDGYWNKGNETPTYGPLDLAGSEVGQQDGVGQEVRPYRDGSSQTHSITRTTVTTGGTRTFTTPHRWTRTTYNFGFCQVQTCSAASGSYNRIQTYELTQTTKTIESFVNGVSTGAPTNVSGYPQTTQGNLLSTSPSSTPTGSCNTNSWSNQGGAYLCFSGAGAAWIAGNTTSVDAVGTTVQPTVVETSPTVIRDGDSNSLADVAQYYWKTDLRPSLANNVKADTADTATHQHMNTFTIGLGLKGTLQPTDFAAIQAGTKNWPTPIGTDPASDPNASNATHIDDLWHAAVNGRGRYFSVSDPTTLGNAITDTLKAIDARTGAGAGAAASSLTPVSGDDWLFVPSYTTVAWSGDLKAFRFTFDSNNAPVTPNTATATPAWSAQARLDSRNLTSSPRTLYFNRNGALTAFNYTNLGAASLASHFDTRCTRATAADNLSQCANLTATPKAKVTGANLVAFLAGDTSLHLNSESTDNRVFRSRASRLGDFVNAAPLYVSKPPFRYADSGYAAFAAAQANRTRMVYAAGNDGMLHAFCVEASDTNSACYNNGGHELWAFTPTAVIPHLWRLADENYGSNHRYYVDATPTVADVYDSTNARWRTILVGGQGGGGRSYYALDITTPESPALLWEFSHTNLGLTFGNPVVTKNAAGTWIVAFTSGVNNVNPGDGVGRLYVLNALTGAAMADFTPAGQLSTGAGDTTTPSNLGRLNAWVNSDTDNLALRFYAGDMLGNLWRFDHDNRIAPDGREATLLGRAMTAATGGSPQPITAKPLLTQRNVNGVPVVIVSFGTGRLMGLDDLSNSVTQSIYSVKDSLAASGLGVLRSTGASLVQQTLNSSRLMSTVQPVDWTTQNGWYVDLDVGAPSGGSNNERIHIDGLPLSAGTLAFSSTMPTADACEPGGRSYLYQLNVLSGNVISTTPFDAMLVGLSRITDSRGQVTVVSVNNRGGVGGTLAGGGLLPGNPTLRRSSWRELME